MGPFDEHSMANLQSIARRHGYAVHDVPSDGDCLFHAVNCSMKNVSINSIEMSTIRKNLRDFMHDNQTIYRDFVYVENYNHGGRFMYFCT